MSKERNKAAAVAPPMDGQTAWENEPMRVGEPAGTYIREHGQAGNAASEANPYAGFAEPDKGAPPDTSQAGGKRKGPRKPRSPARTVCYVEKLMSRFTLAQLVAMYAMLSSVTEPTLTDGAEQP